MIDEHHTTEQIDKAFAYAPTILRKLKEAGVPCPSFELYADASGRLRLGEEGEVTMKQFKLAQGLLFTKRPYQMFCQQCLDAGGSNLSDHTHPIGATFCCGLVVAAENNL